MYRRPPHPIPPPSPQTVQPHPDPLHSLREEESRRLASISPSSPASTYGEERDGRDGRDGEAPAFSEHYVSDGARKEKLRQRWLPARRPRPPPLRRAALASAFSFLDGSSLPEDLIERAAELELPAVALVDRNGVYGAPRFYKAAPRAGIKALVGAEVVIDAPSAAPMTSERRAWQAPRRQPRQAADPTKLARENELASPLLVANRTGYKNLCRLLTAAAPRHPKGEARADWDMLAEHAAGLRCLTGGDEGPLARALARAGSDGRAGRAACSSAWARSSPAASRRAAAPPAARRGGAQPGAGRSRARLPPAARRHQRRALRARATTSRSTTCSPASARHHARRAPARCSPRTASGTSRAPPRWRALFADLPRGGRATLELAARARLHARRPRLPLPRLPAAARRDAGLLPAPAHLERRPRPLPAAHREGPGADREGAGADREARPRRLLPDRLGHRPLLPAARGILVQGRGSAANSAVCYALSITAVDPVKMELLFERFLSEERGEWPDIDLDLPSGDQREKVIQYVYRRYGVRGAAMTANVITYRDRSAAREVAKVLGYSPETGRPPRQAARQLQLRPARAATASTSASSSPPPASTPTSRACATSPSMWRRIQNLPRHLGQHSGGMVIAAGRLDEVVPLEPAAMPGRVVVQWDKDDCADLGIIKVDLLGLGMLDALEEAVPMIRAHEGDARRPRAPAARRPGGLRACCRRPTRSASSRSRAARRWRRCRATIRTRFYDLVIQVAIIRPGPIVGEHGEPLLRAAAWAASR